MKEFVNRNEYRSYPFSSDRPVVSEGGEEFPVDVVVDAIVYPINPSGKMLLSEFDSAEGFVRMVDEGGTIELLGSVSGRKAELFQDGKHAGTIVFGSGLSRELKSGRRWVFESAVLSSSCVVPVCGDRVTSIGIADTDKVARTHIIEILGNGRLSTTNGQRTINGVKYETLKFNVRPGSRSHKKKGKRGVLRKIIVATTENSLFTIWGGCPVNGQYAPCVPVYVGFRLSREDICYHVNKSSIVSSVSDTCAPEGGGSGADASIADVCIKAPGGHVEPVQRQVCYAGVILGSGDILGLRNPVKISVVHGTASPNAPSMSPVMGFSEATEEVGKLTRSPVYTGCGIKIEIPGLGGT